MMRFWAKVTFKSAENATEVIRAFFQNFHSESSIVIRGKEAKVEIFFDTDLPMQLVEAISNCEVVEFNYGRKVESYEDETVSKVNEKKEEILESSETQEEEKEVSEESKVNEPVAADDETKDESETKEEPEANGDDLVEEKMLDAKPKKKRGRKAAIHAANGEKQSIPYLKELAEKSENFEHFVKLVAEWLELDKRQEFFEKLALATKNVSKVSWKELDKVLNENGVYYSQWDKIWTVRHISEKLAQYSVTILPLLEMIAQYKNYSFADESLKEIAEVSSEEVSMENAESTSKEVSEAENDSVTSEESVASTESPIEAKRVKMECMPEIPEFEEVLSSIDKTRPIEDRLKVVLTAMGWEKMKMHEQEEIFEIANAAVRVREMTFDNIFRKAGFLVSSVMKERMTFSTFLNNFVSAHAPGEKVKVLVFLKQLQEIVMLDSEIEALSDFNDETL